MLKKMFSFAGMLLLAGAAVLMTTGGVQARGGGHGGGLHGGGSHRGGFHGSWHGGGGWHHLPAWRGYYFAPYYYGGYNPYYGYYHYPYIYGESYSLENAYADDTPLLTGSVMSVPAPIDNTAHITVRVPAEAQVWIQGTKTPSTGSVRQFETPPLTPGSRYGYDIKANWN